MISNKKIKFGLSAFLLIVGLVLFAQVSIISAQLGVDQGDYDEIKRYTQDDMDWPFSELQVIPEGFITPQEDLSFAMKPNNFTDIENNYYNYYVDSLPFHSLVAGTSDQYLKSKDGENYVIKNAFGTVIYNSEGDFGHIGPISFQGSGIGDRSDKLGNYISRDTAGDTDNDGMDDEWEIYHFANKRIPGTDDFYPSSSDREAVLNAVKPGDDPDKDGYLFTIEYDYSTYDQSILDPNASFTKPFQKAYQLGTPYVLSESAYRAESFNGSEITGDGTFTNLEEFVFGTEPLNSDSDGDGITDEHDVLGYNQQSTTFKVNKKIEEEYKVRAFTFGETTRWKSFPQEEPYFQYFLAGLNPDLSPGKMNNYARGGDSSYALWYIPVKVSGGDKFDVQLTVEPQTVSLLNTGRNGQDPIKVTATPTMAQEGFSSLMYRWFINGKLSEELDNLVTPEEFENLSEIEKLELQTSARSGYGKDKLIFSVAEPDRGGQTKGVCDSHIVTIDVYEDVTGRSATTDTEIMIGSPVEFTKQVIGSLSDDSDININDKYTQDLQGLQSAVDENDLDGVNETINEGVRINDLVSFKANLIGLDNPKCIEEGYTINNLNFRWYFDSSEQHDKSGVGNKFSEATFMIDSLAPIQTKTSDNPSYDGMANTVKLQVYKADTGELFTETEEVIAAINPAIEVTPESDSLELDTTAGESGSDGNSIKYKAKVGEELDLKAKLQYFRPSSTYTYTWKRGSETIGPIDTGELSSVYSFTPNTTGTELITIDVVGAETGESAITTIEIEVLEESAFEALVLTPLTPGFVAKYLPDWMKTWYGLFGMFVLFVFLSVGVLTVYKSKAVEEN